MILQERRKLIKVINEKNLLLTKKIELVDGLQQKIVGEYGFYKGF